MLMLISFMLCLSHKSEPGFSGTTLQTNIADTRTVIVEVKYINSKNVVIHSENCKAACNNWGTT